jgi:prepilin-type N-terminal cleavage/methylation domain-containing protein
MKTTRDDIGLVDGAAAPRRGVVASVRRGFTLVEIIVVLTVISILVLLAVPAFTSLIASQEETAAEARLRAGVAVARDASIANALGEDTGAVFTYDPQGPIRIVAVTRIGSFIDTTLAVPAVREVFVPIDGVEPVTLPGSWMVRAYAPVSAFDGEWYGVDASGTASVMYDNTTPNWVFPETGFFNHTVENDGRNRQTFMIRFQGGTGQVVGSTPTAAVVLLPRPSDQNRTLPQDLWPNRASDFRRIGERLLKNPSLDVELQTVLGGASSDVALVRPVQILALTDEVKLADAVGARLDRFSNSMYLIPPGNFATLALSPQFVPAQGTQTAQFINRYIEGFDDLTPNGNAQLNAQRTGVKIFTIDRYGGELVRSVNFAPTTGLPQAN